MCLQNALSPVVICDYCGTTTPGDEDREPPRPWITHDGHRAFYVSRWHRDSSPQRIGLGQRLDFCSDDCHREWVLTALLDFAMRPIDTTPLS